MKKNLDYVNSSKNIQESFEKIENLTKLIAEANVNIDDTENNLNTWLTQLETEANTLNSYKNTYESDLQEKKNELETYGDNHIEQRSIHYSYEDIEDATFDFLRSVIVSPKHEINNYLSNGNDDSNLSSNRYKSINYKPFVECSDIAFLNTPYDNNWSDIVRSKENKLIKIKLSTYVKVFEFSLHYRQYRDYVYNYNDDIIRTQNENELCVNRYYKGKFIVSGIPNDQIGSSMPQFEVRAIIYNGDNDVSSNIDDDSYDIEPSFILNFYKDSDNFYLGFDTISPFKQTLIKNGIRSAKIIDGIDNCRFDIDFTLIDKSLYNQDQFELVDRDQLVNIVDDYKFTLKSSNSGFIQYHGFIPNEIYNNLSPEITKYTFKNYKSNQELDFDKDNIDSWLSEYLIKINNNDNIKNKELNYSKRNYRMFKLSDDHYIMKNYFLIIVQRTKEQLSITQKGYPELNMFILYNFITNEKIIFYPGDDGSNDISKTAFNTLMFNSPYCNPSFNDESMRITRDATPIKIIKDDDLGLFLIVSYTGFYIINEFGFRFIKYTDISTYLIQYPVLNIFNDITFVDGDVITSVERVDANNLLICISSGSKDIRSSIVYRIKHDSIVKRSNIDYNIINLNTSIFLKDEIKDNPVIELKIIQNKLYLLHKLYLKFSSTTTGTTEPNQNVDAFDLTVNKNMDVINGVSQNYWKHFGILDLSDLDIVVKNINWFSFFDDFKYEIGEELNSDREQSVARSPFRNPHEFDDIVIGSASQILVPHQDLVSKYFFSHYYAGIEDVYYDNKTDKIIFLISNNNRFNQNYYTGKVFSSGGDLVNDIILKTSVIPSEYVIFDSTNNTFSYSNNISKTNNVDKKMIFDDTLIIDEDDPRLYDIFFRLSMGTNGYKRSLFESKFSYNHTQNHLGIFIDYFNEFTQSDNTKILLLNNNNKIRLSNNYMDVIEYIDSNKIFNNFIDISDTLENKYFLTNKDNSFMYESLNCFKISGFKITRTVDEIKNKILSILSDFSKSYGSSVLYTMRIRFFNNFFNKIYDSISTNSELEDIIFNEVGKYDIEDGLRAIEYPIKNTYNGKILNNILTSLFRSRSNDDKFNLVRNSSTYLKTLTNYRNNGFEEYKQNEFNYIDIMKNINDIDSIIVDSPLGNLNKILNYDFFDVELTVYPSEAKFEESFLSENMIRKIDINKNINRIINNTTQRVTVKLHTNGIYNPPSYVTDGKGLNIGTGSTPFYIKNPDAPGIKYDINANSPTCLNINYYLDESINNTNYFIFEVNDEDKNFLNIKFIKSIDKEYFEGNRTGSGEEGNLPCSFNFDTNTLYATYTSDVEGAILMYDTRTNLPVNIELIIDDLDKPTESQKNDYAAFCSLGFFILVE